VTTAEEVVASLTEVIDPCSAATGVPLSIVDMGLVRHVSIEGGEVRVELRLTTPLCHQVPYFIMEIERLVGALDGVRSVTCDHDVGIEWHPGLMSPAASGRLAAGLRELERRAVSGPTVHHNGAKESDAYPPS
jgi:metal-sulfur cluster biosynthetic enzyme